MYKKGTCPHLDAVLDKMCEVVGAEDVDFSAHDWYWQHTWCQAQEDEFKDWFIDYLRNRKAQAALMQYPRGAKKDRKLFAEAWIWNYGWKEKR